MLDKAPIAQNDLCCDVLFLLVTFPRGETMINDQGRPAACAMNASTYELVQCPHSFAPLAARKHKKFQLHPTVGNH